MRNQKIKIFSLYKKTTKLYSNLHSLTKLTLFAVISAIGCNFVQYRK